MTRRRGAAAHPSKRFAATSRRPDSSLLNGTGAFRLALETLPVIPLFTFHFEPFTFHSMSIRLGAVGYLNARPLTWALDRAPERWQVRYDVPSICASLLHGGSVDLGLIPSVEY